MANRTRPKTNEQKTREYLEIKEIEGERARQRQVENAKRTAAMKVDPEISNPENFPGSKIEKGEARDIAAAKIGLSGKTAEKGAEILEAGRAMRYRKQHYYNFCDKKIK